MRLRFIKRIFVSAMVILLLSGCSVVYINKQSIDEVVDTILAHDTDLKTISVEGYSYYLPQGVNLKNNKFMNSVLYYNHRKMYLYVDLISYYHKKEYEYKKNDSYYSRALEFNNKKGYLEITELDNEYFIEFMYNYSKMEAYVKKEDLKKTLTVMAYILNSIKYQDNTLDSLVGDGTLNYREEQFNIFKSTGNDNSDFLETAEQYDDGRKNSKDEDILDIEKNVE